MSRRQNGIKSSIWLGSWPSEHGHFIQSNKREGRKYGTHEIDG